MAGKSKRSSSSSKAKPLDAVALLKADHRQVEQWFSQFAKATSAGKKQQLASNICAALTVHTEIEEEISRAACLPRPRNPTWTCAVSASKCWRARRNYSHRQRRLNHGKQEDERLRQGQASDARKKTGSAQEGRPGKKVTPAEPAAASAGSNRSQ